MRKHVWKTMMEEIIRKFLKLVKKIKPSPTLERFQQCSAEPRLQTVTKVACSRDSNLRCFSHVIFEIRPWKSSQTLQTNISRSR